ncbi:hypothetical protein [Nonomuraea sp. NPDC050786]|uniref:hypothetical protein n=1 Tax=Nonomuraea sp. NPDC050786 TaxID=3154840 RepID=UPI0033F7E60D
MDRSVLTGNPRSGHDRSAIEDRSWRNQSDVGGAGSGGRGYEAQGPLQDRQRIDRLSAETSTTLYASLFRYDDDILVNPHAYGEPASANPTFHFRRLDGGTTADHYMSSFERVWAGAAPWSGAEI